ncbi:MAG: glycosyltransferase family 39 protein [Anaerolineae bacterium]|nr:glycosyltransferase family 39 protein [Anaerolineae bacterium]
MPFPPILFLLLAVLVLILAAGLRLHRIDHQSLWYDEGVSAGETTLPSAQIVENASHDIHPPGYYLLLKGWAGIAGRSELSLRYFSTLASVIAAALVIAIGRKLFDAPTGLIAGALISFNPFQVWYAQEVRMYALLGMVSAASIFLCIRVLEHITAPRRRSWPVFGAYALINVLGLYTHYTFPFVLLAESLVFLIVWIRRGHKWQPLGLWVGIQIAALIVFAPWMPAAYRQITTWPTDLGERVGWLPLISTIVYGRTLPPESMLNSLIPLLLLAIVGLFPPVDDEESPHGLAYIEKIGLIVLWLLIPVLIPTAMGAIRATNLKFFVPAGLTFYLLVGRGIVTGFRIAHPVPGSNHLNAWMVRIVVLILMIAGLFPLWQSLNNLYSDPTYARDDYRGLAERIRSEGGEDATVVLDSPGQAAIFGYYFDGPNVTPLPNASTEETLAGLIAAHDRIYAVYYGENEQDPEGIVARMLSENAFVASDEWIGNVRLVRYVVPAQASNEIAQISGAVFGESIRLAGYTISSESLVPGDALAVTLFWETDAPIEKRYRVFVHLYKPDGTIATQHDGEPNSSLTPTTSWVPGETVIDNHGMLLTGDAAAGVYPLMIGLYDAESGDRLPIELAGEPVGDRLLLVEIEVGP